jgi:hypothetical protein
MWGLRRQACSKPGSGGLANEQAGEEVVVEVGADVCIGSEVELVGCCVFVDRL